MVIGIAALIAVIGPWIAPHDPNATDGITLQFQSAPGHLLGYDANGRDVFSRLLAGARTSMVGPLIVVTVSILLGVTIAIAAAWRGGRFDTLVSGALDIAFAFPGILLAILAAAVFGAGLFAAICVLSFAYTPYIARVVRGSALQERSKPYIAALEVQGMSPWAICFRHLLPNLSGIVVAQATTLFGYAMVDLAAISFIGLGVQQPAADWGVMVFENRQGIAHRQTDAGARRRAVPHRRRDRVQHPRRAPGPAARGATVTALLEIDDLVVQLPVGGSLRPVLRGIDLRLDAGEALGLVGESGSGKSMTARAIDRLLPAGAVSTGSIRFDGVDVASLRGDDLRRFRRDVVDGVPGSAVTHQPGASHRRLHDRGGAWRTAR